MKHIKLFEQFKGTDFKLVFKISDTEDAISAINELEAAYSLFEANHNGFRGTFACYDKESNEHTFQIKVNHSRNSDDIEVSVHIEDGDSNFLKECLAKDISAKYYYDYEMHTKVSLDHVETVNELNHQTPDSGNVNRTGFGQGSHYGNWGADFGNSDKGVRGHFGKKGDVNSPNLDQRDRGYVFPEVVHDPVNDKMLTQDEVEELIRQYEVAVKQNSDTPLKFRGINSRVIKFIRDYLKYQG